MDGQREKARSASAFEMKRGERFTYASAAEEARVLGMGDRFEGYTATSVADAVVEALFDAGRVQVTSLDAGVTGFVVLSSTPFYVESGGQVSDEGTIIGTMASATVTGMTRLTTGGVRAHVVSSHRGFARGWRARLGHRRCGAT